jgi:outer membrane protein TolC
MAAALASLMITRPLLAASLAGMLLVAPAYADRRAKATSSSSMKKTSAPAKKAAPTNDDDDGPADPSDRRRVAGDDRASKADRKAAARREVADADEDADTDGPEAKAAVPIKLEDLIEVAFRQAPDIMRAKIERNAAKGQIDVAKAKGQWNVDVKTTYSHNGLGAEVDTPAFSEVDSEEIRGSITVGKGFFTGGRMELEFGVSQVSKEFAVPEELLKAVNGGTLTDTQKAQLGPDGTVSDTATQNTAYAKATFRQPVLKEGPGIAGAGKKKADLQHTEAVVRIQLAAEKLIKEIVSGYWDLAYASYEVDVRAESLALAEQQDKITREEIRANLAPRTALNAVTFEIMTRKEALLAAQNEYERKSLELRNKVGLGLERRDIVLRPEIQFEIGNAEWDIEDVRQRAHQMNRNLAAIALQRRQAEVDIDIAKNNMLPSLDFTVSGGVGGDSNRSFGEAFDNAAGQTSFQVFAGVELKFDIGPAARGSYDTALAKKGKTELDRMEAERLIDTEVARAVKTVTSARARVALADKAIEVAKENARAEVASFQAQQPNVTNYTVMQRQTDIANAKLRRGKAITDYHTAVAELQYLSGALLEQYDLKVRPHTGDTNVEGN